MTENEERQGINREAIKLLSINVSAWLDNSVDLANTIQTLSREKREEDRITILQLSRHIVDLEKSLKQEYAHIRELEGWIKAKKVKQGGDGD